MPYLGASQSNEAAGDMRPLMPPVTPLRRTRAVYQSATASVGNAGCRLTPTMLLSGRVGSLPLALFGRELVPEIEHLPALNGLVIVERDGLLRQVDEVGAAQVVAHGRSRAARVDVAGPAPGRD